MQINRETPEQHSIQTYSDLEVVINQQHFCHSFIVSHSNIIHDWPVHCANELNEATLQPILDLNPEIILIGQANTSLLVPIAIRAHLAKQRIGIECMSIGAASRTFNILLSEGRKVVAGFIFPENSLKITR